MTNEEQREIVALIKDAVLQALVEGADDDPDWEIQRESPGDLRPPYRHSGWEPFAIASDDSILWRRKVSR